MAMKNRITHASYAALDSTDNILKFVHQTLRYASYGTEDMVYSPFELSGLADILEHLDSKIAYVLDSAETLPDEEERALQ